MAYNLAVKARQYEGMMAEAGRDQADFLDDDLAEPARSGVTSRSIDQSASRRSRGRRRMAFFALAAAWGFFSGTSAVLVTLNLLGRPLYLAPPLVLILAIAAVAALGGGLIVAAAYRENTRR